MSDVYDNYGPSGRALRSVLSRLRLNAAARHSGARWNHPMRVTVGIGGMLHLRRWAVVLAVLLAAPAVPATAAESAAVCEGEAVGRFPVVLVHGYSGGGSDEWLSWETSRSDCGVRGRRPASVQLSKDVA